MSQVNSEVSYTVRDVVSSWFVEQSSTKQCCGIFTADDACISLPLKKRLVTGTVDCDLGVAETVEILSYQFDSDCSATFKFPLPTRCAVYSFEARVGDKVIRTQTKKKARAEAEYQTAVHQGHTAVLAKQTSTDVYSVDLGNLPANQTCEIKIGYLKLLNKVSNTVEYMHTATWVPPYQGGASATAGFTPDAADPTYTAKVSYSLSYTIRILSHVAIKSITTSNPGQTIDSPNGKIVNLNLEVADAGKDFELVVELENSTGSSRLQRQVCQRGGETKTMLLATFLPRLAHLPSPGSAPNREIWLVVDCSGSMMGDPIRQAREAALFFIKDMPLDGGVRFNIVAFGSSFKFMYGEARLYNQYTNAEAVQWVNHQLSDMGGTEILNCFNAIDRVPITTGYTRQVIFLTDGGVNSSEEAAILTLARRPGGPRYFSLGIGHGVHRGLLVGLAEATSGVTQFVTDDAAITRRCNVLKKCAMSDALLCKPRLTCRSSVMHLVPAVMPDVLFLDQPITVLAEVTAAQEGAALELSAQVAGGEGGMWREELKLSEAVEARGDMLPVLHAMGYVSGLLSGRSALHLQPDGIPRSPRPSQEMVDEEVVRAAVAENLVTPLTASVGVLLQADPLDPTKVQHVDVPIQVPQGRTMWTTAPRQQQQLQPLQSPSGCWSQSRSRSRSPVAAACMSRPTHAVSFGAMSRQTHAVSFGATAGMMSPSIVPFSAAAPGPAQNFIQAIPMHSHSAGPWPAPNPLLPAPMQQQQQQFCSVYATASPPAPNALQAAAMQQQQQQQHGSLYAISVQGLNELRTADGFWVSSPGLLGMLGAGGDKAVALQAARPDGVADDEWATLLVLAYLRKHLAGEAAVWEGMAEKAQQWLQNRWPPAARSVAMTIIATMKLL